MAEAGGPDNLTKYIPVESKHITRQTAVRGGLQVTERPTSDNVGDMLRSQLLIFELLMQADRVRPTTSLEQGFLFAGQVVNHLRHNIGLPEITDKDIQVVLLERDKFQKHKQSFTGEESTDTLAFASGDLSPVAVMLQGDVPEYLTASMACHELVHKWLEQHVRVYSSIENADRTGQDKSSQQYRRLLTESRRSGLAVKKVGYENGQFTQKERIGEILNEIPNYMVQAAYIREVLRKDSGMFEGEANVRRQMLSKYLKESGIEETDISGKLFVADGKPVVLDIDNMHFDSNGKPLFEGNSLPYFVMQLGSDLSRVCGDIDNQPFGNVLLEAKTNPVIQNKIKTVVDAKMGEGFFARLRNADFSGKDVIPLLSEVQAKLYPPSTFAPQNSH